MQINKQESAYNLHDNMQILNVFDYIFINLLVIKRKNIWISCAVHSIWNFGINSFCGLTVTENESVTESILIFETGKPSILNGAEFGIEASVTTTIVCAIIMVIIIFAGKGGKNSVESFYETVATENNKARAKKTLKTVGIVFAVLLGIDIISFVVYVCVYGFPQ